MGAAALFAACGASQPPIATPNLLQKSSPTHEIVHTQSLGPAYKAPGPLLYVANWGPTEPVSIYDANANDPSPSPR